MPYRARMGMRALLLAIACALSACGTSEIQLTATLEIEAAQTQITTQHATATAARAAMQTTQHFVSTRIAQVEQAGQFLRSTLVALGTASGFIEGGLRALSSFPSPIPRSADPAGIDSRPPAASPTRLPITPATAVPTVPTRPASDARFENIVMASGVGSDDCALDVNPRFTPSSAAIYVVANAYKIPAGATISSSWQRANTEVALFSFDAQRAINGSCIWFFIDQSDTPFFSGSWSVELRLDGAALAVMPFQIAEN